MNLKLDNLSENEKQFILIIMYELKENNINLNKISFNTNYDFTKLHWQSISENIYNKMTYGE